MGDTLTLWNTTEVPESEKNFNFTSENQIYEVSSNIGSSTADTLNINGHSDGKSVIDLNNYTGFELDNATTLNLNNVKLTGNNTLITVNNINADINLNNVDLDGSISSTNTYDLGIFGKTKLKGSVGNANITINPDSNLSLLSNNHFENSNVTVNKGVTLNLVNNSTEIQLSKSFAIVGDMIMNVDVDLANRAMDRLPENTTVANNASIGVKGINLLSDSVNNITKIPFANSLYAKNVKYIGANEISKETQLTTAFAPIYKYGVSYNPDDGTFQFSRAGNNPTYNEVNPAIMSEQVASQFGGYLNLVNTYDEAFNNMNAYMFLTKEERLAIKNANKYAAIGNIPFKENYQYHNNAGWFRPYSIFEKVKLKNGPAVSNVSYGTFFGGDSELIQLKKGWDFMWGLYGSYNGSHQAYDGISLYQNGGIFGITGMAYKDNFFTGLTVATGASAVEANTMYGHDNFAMMMAGIASKSGYNFELAKGKLILQPNFLLSYSFVNTFDYTNAAGIKIKADPLNAIQIEPGLRIIGNHKNGWQPYANVSMVWNVIDDAKLKVNDVSLPNLSIKPYVKYSVGIKKTWVERFSGFLQTYITNGGRNGVGIQFGVRWNF